jgi:hypothetical protein
VSPGIKAIGKRKKIQKFILTSQKEKEAKASFSLYNYTNILS